MPARSSAEPGPFISVIRVLAVTGFLSQDGVGSNPKLKATDCVYPYFHRAHTGLHRVTQCKAGCEEFLTNVD